MGWEIHLGNRQTVEPCERKRSHTRTIYKLGRESRDLHPRSSTHDESGFWATKHDNVVAFRHKSLGFNKNFVSKAITVAENLSNFPTLGNIGIETLYLIATLPDEEKAEQLDRIEQDDNSTSTVPLYLALSPKLDNVVQLRPRGRIR